MLEDTDDEMREFDRLAREEAEERGELYQSPFDAAAIMAAPESELAASPQLSFGEVPKKRSHAKKGRTPTGKPRGRPPREGAKLPRSHSAQVKGPPAPPATASAPQATPAAQQIPSAQLIPLVKRLDGMIAKRAGTERLADEELSEGAQALAQLMHHYLPTALNTPWGPFAAWVLLAYGPRMMDRQEPAQRLSVTLAQEDVAKSAATFRAPDAAPVATASPEVYARESVTPIFRNPLLDLPDAVATGIPT